MVLEEGLDMSSLPDTLREDFDQLDRLQGQFRVTSILIEVVNVVDMSSGEGPPCGFCNVKEETEKFRTLLEQLKPMTTLSKVILSRRSDTGFGIWDLARKLATKARFGAFGQNRNFFGTIL